MFLLLPCQTRDIKNNSESNTVAYIQANIVQSSNWLSVGHVVTSLWKIRPRYTKLDLEMYLYLTSKNYSGVIVDIWNYFSCMYLFLSLVPTLWCKVNELLMSIGWIICPFIKTNCTKLFYMQFLKRCHSIKLLIWC